MRNLAIGCSSELRRQHKSLLDVKHTAQFRRGMINHHFVDDLVNLNINRIKDARQEMWQRQPEDVVEFSNSEGTWQRVGDSDQRGSQVLGGVWG